MQICDIQALAVRNRSMARHLSVGMSADMQSLVLWRTADILEASPENVHLMGKEHIEVLFREDTALERSIMK